MINCFIACWNCIRGCALKHSEVSCLASNVGNALHCRRARTNEPDSLASEIDSLVWPLAGVIRVAGESVGTWELRSVGRRQAASGKHHKTRGDYVAFIGGGCPCVVVFVEVCRKYARRKLNGVAQVESFSNMLGVLQNFRLRRVSLGPFPFLLQVVVETVGILNAFHVTACARVSIPIPRTTNICSGFKDLDAEP